MESCRVPGATIGTAGATIPVVGLGTWRSQAGHAREAVQCAIDAGYRHIDCAFHYGNEADIGRAINEKIADGHVNREDLFIVSKLWNTFHSSEDVKPALQKSLQNLGLTYLDLYLIHFPTAFQRGGPAYPRNDNGQLLYADTHYLETWQALEKCVDEGLVRNIGLSNFNSLQIQDILDNCRIRPANLQVEIHPYFSQDGLVEYCHREGLTITAYSPLASPDNPGTLPECSRLLEEPTLLRLGTKYNKSAAQVVLRWLLQRKIVVIPKSVTPSRIKENIQLFDFELTTDDMASVKALDKHTRLVASYLINKDG
ncbi:hypothetical protein NP493_299g00019 [Ridgeia piscesae]|uniref:NADP-dependent oxidoreductase domain-containing protein n=1 Tax=Ridgeia piscesae TaxID=27915 RepID=A0AAD9L6V7_RIDPI|nr:hypothetical protein NP493_299g00019 [Ridgeia piscesae]